MTFFPQNVAQWQEESLTNPTLPKALVSGNCQPETPSRDGQPLSCDPLGGKGSTSRLQEGGTWGTASLTSEPQPILAQRCCPQLLCSYWAPPTTGPCFYWRQTSCGSWSAQRPEASFGHQQDRPFTLCVSTWVCGFTVTRVIMVPRGALQEWTALLLLVRTSPGLSMVFPGNSRCQQSLVRPH